VSRAALQAEYPARFQLVAAMNPCSCGYLGEPTGNCRCAPPDIARYRARISGPLLDRIDLRVAVPTVSSELLLDDSPADPNALTTAVAARQVRAARAAQQVRAGQLNAALSGPDVQRFCQLDRHGRRLLALARAKLSLSARGVHRVLRVARTIADLEQAAYAGDSSNSCAAAILTPAQLAEALQLRRDI